MDDYELKLDALHEAEMKLRKEREAATSELERLRAEVERLNVELEDNEKSRQQYLGWYYEEENKRRALQSDNADLTAEVERLKAQIGRIAGWLDSEIIMEPEEKEALLTDGYGWIDDMRALAESENERLRAEMWQLLARFNEKTSRVTCLESDNAALKLRVQSLEAQVETAKRAIVSEPELPDEMPDEMWEAIQNDRDAMQEALRITIQLTKQNILAAIERIEKGEG